MKTALVTGGTRGIGKEISIQLKSKGYNVIALYKSNVENAEKFKKETEINTIKCDVTNYEECKTIIEEILVNNNIYILVNNAGITHDKFCHKMNISEWNNVISTNLTSCFIMSKFILEHMRKNKCGKIINISSISAQIGLLGQANYSASKSAIVGFTKTLSNENAGLGITVNCISPGFIDTEMLKTIPKNILDNYIETIPMKKIGSIDSVAHCVIFLIENNYITGQNININGGLYM